MIKLKSLRRLFSTPRTKGTLSIEALYKNIESSEIASIYLGYVDILGRVRGITFNPEIFKNFYLPDQQLKPISNIDDSQFLPGCVMRSNLFFNRHSSTFEVLNSEKEEELNTQKVYLHPDMSTARYWSGNKVLVLSHLYEKEHNGQFKAHPLYFRNKLIERMNANLREIQIRRAQLTFYLYSGSDSSSINWTMSSDKSANLNEIQELERQSEILEEMTYQLINSGIPVTSLRGVEGNSQYEISLTGDCSVLEICDRLALSKAKLKEVAQQKKKTITTMALPYSDQPGNSVQCEHGSRLRFTEQKLNLLLDNLIFLAPNPNSFKRLRLIIGNSNSLEEVSSCAIQIEEKMLSSDSLVYLCLPLLLESDATGESLELASFKEQFPSKFEDALVRFEESTTPFYGDQIRGLYSSIARNELKVRI